MANTKLSDNLREAVEAVHEGWYSEGRIDWEDFIDRVENLLPPDEDLGDSMVSPTVNAIEAYVRKIRAQS